MTLQQHIADSLKKFDEKWDGCFSDQNGDYINPQVKAFIEQELTQLLEVIRGEVEKLNRYETSYFGDAPYIKRQDVLDLLTIKDK